MYWAWAEAGCGYVHICPRWYGKLETKKRHSVFIFPHHRIAEKFLVFFFFNQQQKQIEAYLTPNIAAFSFRSR